MMERMLKESEQTLFACIKHIPDSVLKLLVTLKASSKAAFLVGGCVRDLLLGNTPKDFDICTDASYEELLALFPDSDKVGAKFNVVIQDGVEIASFRSDGAYSDHRRPDTVQIVTDPHEDSCRRDFTINALMYDPFTGTLLDFHEGVYDLRTRVIRAVGDPNVRFGQEDHLRMLRAIRFAARLGFSIESKTFKAIQAHAAGVKDMAVERLRQELVSMFDLPRAYLAFSLLEESGMMEHLLPEITSLSFQDRQIISSCLASKPKHLAGFAVLLYKLHVQTARQILNRFKYSDEDKDAILEVIALQDRIADAEAVETPAEMKRLLRKRYFKPAMALYGLRLGIDDDVRPHPFWLVELEISRYSEDDLRPQPLLNGKDLITMGLKPGPQFKTILFDVETGQLNGTITSEPQAIDLARKLAEGSASGPLSATDGRIDHAGMR
jgi:tRNA nucleotidyltransferase/poly(A) polymerase